MDCDPPYERMAAKNARVSARVSGPMHLSLSSKLSSSALYCQSSLVFFILPISKEASPARFLGWIWCDVSSRTFLAGLSALLRKAKCILFYFRVLRVV